MGKRVSKLIIVFSSLLAEHLGVTPKDDYSDLISREDLRQLNRVGNRPLHVTNLIGYEIRTIPDQTEGGQILFSSRERLKMLQYVDEMSQSIGKCELLVQIS